MKSKIPFFMKIPNGSTMKKKRISYHFFERKGFYFMGARVSYLFKKITF